MFLHVPPPHDNTPQYYVWLKMVARFRRDIVRTKSDRRSDSSIAPPTPPKKVFKCKCPTSGKQTKPIAKTPPSFPKMHYPHFIALKTRPLKRYLQTLLKKKGGGEEWKQNKTKSLPMRPLGLQPWPHQSRPKEKVTCHK